jgi:hypothetical protein
MSIEPGLNIQDYNAEASGYKILNVGQPGSGKTTQFSTLPGKKFIYLFDPNAKESLSGDIEYQEFIPDITDLDISAKSLRAPEKQKTVDKPTLKDTEPLTFINFEKDFAQRYNEGYFKGFDWVGFDGLTTLSEIMMGRIQYLAKRPGKNPEQADYTAEMNMMKSVIRVLSSLPNIYCTAHVEMMKDDLRGGVYWQLVVTGKNRLRIPLRFNEVIGYYSELVAGKGVEYYIKTEPDRDHPVIRTTARLRKTSSPVTVTLNRSRPIVGQGLGGLIPWKTK